MGDTPKDVLGLLTQLMPGFLTAWVVYGLTTYTKPGQFERVVQALIYSYGVNVLVALLKVTLLSMGKYWYFGIWDQTTELIDSGLIAVSLGVVLSYLMTNDPFFALARRLHLTTRTPYPSEWYGAFAANQKYVVLHLSGARRITGFPSEWPTEPASGHFRLRNAAWLNDENQETLLGEGTSILIASADVEMVEILEN